MDSDAGARGAECLEHDDLADTPVACAGDRAGEDHDARENAEGREELNDVRDLQDDLAHDFERRRNIDDGDGRDRPRRVCAAARLCRGIAVHAAVPDCGETGERGLRQDELRARVGVLRIGFVDRGDRGDEGLVLRDTRVSVWPGCTRSRVACMRPIATSGWAAPFAPCAGGPPFAFDDPVTRRRCVSDGGSR